MITKWCFSKIEITPLLHPHSPETNLLHAAFADSKLMGNGFAGIAQDPVEENLLIARTENYFHKYAMVSGRCVLS